MGRATCRVKIGRFKWKRGGYAELMDSAGVQGMLDEIAQGAAASANSAFSPHPGEGAGYAVETVQGTIAKGRVIRTASPHAAASERKHNRLQGIFGGK